MVFGFLLHPNDLMTLSIPFAEARITPTSVRSPAPLPREIVLSGLNVGVLASLFTFGAAPRPSSIGVQVCGLSCKQGGLA
jgi:hypothetical protein